MRFKSYWWGVGFLFVVNAAHHSGKTQHSS